MNNLQNIARHRNNLKCDKQHMADRHWGWCKRRI